MANQIFMRVNEVAEELGISIPFAYRIIRQMFGIQPAQERR